MQKFILLLIFLPLTAFAEGDLPNFRQSNDGIFRGGRPTEEGLAVLKHDFKVRTIINLQGGDIDTADEVVNDFMWWWEPGERPENILAEKNLAESLGMKFVNTPLNSIAPVSPEMDRYIDQALAIMGDQKNHPVYIHCEHGKDRTGLVVALYQVKYLGAEIESAHAEWADSGHDGLHAFFTGSLDDYYYVKAAQLKASRDALRPRAAASGN